MKKIILIALGIISILYGVLVLQVGSGTGFWMVWEAIGVFFLFWAFLLHTDFFTGIYFQSQKADCSKVISVK